MVLEFSFESNVIPRCVRWGNLVVLVFFNLTVERKSYLNLIFDRM